jgi:flagellar motor switch/type III secretory pathway protein FliN
MSAAPIQVSASSAGPRTILEPEPEQVESRWQPIMELPCVFSVDLPLPDFTVRDFLGLSKGSLIRTHWSLTRDVPLRVNQALIGWGEFESISTHLAVRLTELAEADDSWTRS